jgi:hypothetical protein
VPVQAETPLVLPAGEPSQINSLAELDAESRKLGDWIRQGLAGLPAGARIRLGDFLFNNQETDLGLYWRNQLSSLLSSMKDRKFVILTDPAAPADFTLTGEIMRIGGVLRLYTRLTQVETSGVIASWILDAASTAFIESLIGGEGRDSEYAGSDIRPDSYEPDSRQNPVRANLNGQEIPRTLHPNDEDWFSLQVPDNGELALETKGTMDTFLELYEGTSPEARRIASDDDSGAGLNGKIEYFAEAGKTYLAKVRGLGGDTGSYTFSSTFTPMPQDASEPNDTRETAAKIPLGEDLESSFQSEKDEDWYQVEIPDAGGFLIVTTEGSLDTLITLYDAEGAPLAEDDDSGRGLNARASALVPGGTLYIRILEVDGDRGRYTLKTQVRAPGEADAFEPDNTKERAHQITPGEPQGRTFTTAEDEDWAVFTIVKPGLYEIRALGEDPALDTYLELYDAEGEYIDDNDDGGDNYDALIQVELEPGTYFLLITTLDEDPLDNNAYTLSVSPSEEEGM